MKHKPKLPRLILLFFYITLLLCMLIGCCTADPGTWIRVDNQTDQPLNFYIGKLRHSEVPANEIKRIATMEIYPKNIYTPEEKFLITAKTNTGEAVYSENFTWQELDDMNWTIVISP